MSRRFSQGIRKMTPGTIGGQSRVATPLNRRSLDHTVLTPSGCEMFTVSHQTFNGASSVTVSYPEGDSGDFLCLLMTTDTLISTPPGWSLTSGITGAGSVYNRRLYTKFRAGESEVVVPVGSSQYGTALVINTRIGQPPPYATGVIGSTDVLKGAAFTGDFSEEIALFTELDTPGHTLIVPWFETSATCDASISETSWGSPIAPYIKERIDMPSLSPNLANQMVVAVANPSDAGGTLWRNLTVPELAVTRAIFTLRVQSVVCSE